MEKNFHGIRAKLCRKLKLLQTEGNLQNSENFFWQWATSCWNLNLVEIMATGLRMEDRLDGAGNFVPWKVRIVLIFEENELWDEVLHNTTAVPIVVPHSTDAAALTAFNKKDIKARRIILDDVKDHVIPHILSKTYAFQMWDAWNRLFQSSNENRKMGFEGEAEEYRNFQRGGCDILPY